MDKLSSRTLKCHISLMIYRKTHHVSWIIRWKWPLISNLRSSENAPTYTFASNEGLIKAIVNFCPDGSDTVSLVFLMIYAQYSKGINFDWLNGCKCWTLARKTFVWTRVTGDLRNGGPVEMPPIAKPIKIKVQMIASVFAFNV